MVYYVAIIHVCVIFVNILSIPFVIIYEPFYIWMPLVTLLISPLTGGTYCLFNRIENYYRLKANMPKIHDRFYEVIVYFKGR